MMQKSILSFLKTNKSTPSINMTSLEKEVIEKNETIDTKAPKKDNNSKPFGFEKDAKIDQKINIKASLKDNDIKLFEKHQNMNTEATKKDSNPNSFEKEDKKMIIEPSLDMPNYEILRAENIERNMQFLKTLGIFSLQSDSMKHDTLKQKRKKDFPQDFVKRVLPKRGTDKIPNIYLNNDVDDSENCTISENIKQEDVIYDNSDVLTYLLCDEMDSKSKNNDSKKTCMVGVIHANYDKASDDIAVDDNSNMFQFSCDYLQNVYSMHINVSLNSNLLLSAGKGGIVTLFKLDDGIEESSSRDYQSKVEPRNKLLMWFKGHDRWISSARFYSIQKGSHESLNSNGSNNDVNEPNCDSNPNHRVAILTASDDGLVKIWDISKTCRASTTSMTRMHDNESDWDIGGRNSSARVNDKSDVDESQYEQTPQLLVSSACGHSKGIFAMDEKYGVIVTGSKDKSVCVSHLIDRSNVRSANVNKKSNSSTGKGCTGGYDMVTLSTFELHAGVVKSVSIKCNPNDAVSGHVNSDTSCDISYTGQSDLSAVIFASGSQDGDICIKDTRSETGDIRLQHVHSGGVHTVSWCPYTGGEYLLLSAGYDSLVKIFDIRKLSQDSVTNEPLYVVLEHVEAPGGSASRRAQSHRRSNVIQTPCFASNSVIVVPSVTSSSLSVHSVVSQSVISRCVLQHSPLSVMASPYKGGCTSTQRLVVATSTKGIMLNLSIL